MLKKLLKITALAGVLYLVYDRVNQANRNLIAIKEIPVNDVLEMLKAKDFNVVVGYNDKVLHFIKDDKSEAVQARLDEKGLLYLIEYYSDRDGIIALESVYPQAVVLANESGKKARLGFLRMLGSIGLTEKRFILLVKEILANPSLADLTI